MPNPEQVINKPLSGTEVRKIILLKLEQMLSGDTRLADYVAAPAFQFRLDLAIVLAGAVHANINRTITGGQGSVTDDPNQPSTIITHHLEQSPMTPNETRVDAGLGVPVLTRDEKGREVEREIHYTREQKNRATGTNG